METEGKVIGVTGNAITVEVRRKGSCGDHCASCAGCAAQIVQTEAFSDIPVREGDWVLLKSDNRSVFMALIIVLIFPLFLPTAGYFLARPFQWEIPAMTIGLILSFLLIFILNKDPRFRNKLQPRVIKILSTEE